MAPHVQIHVPPAALPTAVVPPSTSPPARTTRSGRVIRDSTRYTESVQQRAENLVAWEVLTENEDSLSQYPQQEEWDIEQQMNDPIAFAASSDPDTMYLHEAMKTPDKAQFLKAMEDEVNAHVKQGHWEFVLRSIVPKGVRVLDSVWAMRRKRKIMTGEIYKWKARLNVHGGQQEKGITYWETYAPVVTWQTIHFFFAIALLRG